MAPPRLLLILTENWTMRPSPDVGDLVRFAVELRLDSRRPSAPGST